MSEESNQDDLKHLLLTGHPSVGKTTIITKVIEAIQQQFAQHQQNERKNNTSVAATTIQVKGFYTEECRNQKGDRIGFDILYWDDNPQVTTGTRTNQNAMNDIEPQRVPLSRRVEKVKKSDPCVGKYLVDIDNISSFAVPAVDLHRHWNQQTNNDRGDETKHQENATTRTTSSTTTNMTEVVIMDEIGKMEMLCPSFLPAVKRSLAMPPLSTTAGGVANNGVKRIILGTIPTPRYGRVIPAVEDIRAMEDVMVVHVTKDNRDRLCHDITQLFISLLTHHQCISSHDKTDSDDDDQHLIQMRSSLSEYIYSRPIGASSMQGKQSSPKQPCRSKQQAILEVKSCGPFVSHTVQPTVLLLGETASSQPLNLDLMYSERSMWIVLNRIFCDNSGNTVECFKPIKEETQVNGETIQNYRELSQSVLSSGICIWDVLSNIHEKNNKKTPKRRKRSGNGTQTPNALDAFVAERSSIKTVAFIGKRAYNTFRSHFIKNEKQGKDSLFDKLNLIVLSSSSPSNTRLTVQEKALEWRSAFQPYITKI